MMQDILDRVKRALKIIFCLALFSCGIKENYRLKSAEVVGEDNYVKIFSLLKDSLRNWSINKLGYYRYCGESKNCYLDSLICFNNNKNRIIGVLLKQQLLKEGVADDIDYIYGEKIKDNWYFFSGPNIFVPREMVKNHDIHTPLSYQQLHEIALKEIYSGYLKRNGEINEDWFTQNFEGAGWGNFNNQAASDFLTHGKRFTSKKDFFEYMHLMVVKANWNDFKKDSVIP